MAVLALGTVFVMAPIEGVVQTLGSLMSLAGIVLVAAGIHQLKFEGRKSLVWNSFALFVAGFVPYALAKYPKTDFAAQVGNAIDDPWLMAIFHGIGISGGVTMLAALLGAFWSTGTYFLGTDDGGPPGPEDL
jgi:hypothetical protein